MSYKNCTICTREFAARGRGKTCSVACAAEALRLRRNAYAKKNPDKCSKRRPLEISALEAKIWRAQRAELGYVQRTFWIHRDDCDSAHDFINFLMSKRRGNK